MNELIFYRFPVYRLTPGINEGLASLAKDVVPGRFNAAETLKNNYAAKIFAAVSELQTKIKKGRLLYNKDAAAHLNRLSDDIDEISQNFSRNIQSSAEKSKIESYYKSARTGLILSNDRINEIFFGGNMLNQILKNNPDRRITATPENAKYLVLHEIADKNVRTEAFMLLAIIEKYWSKDEAQRQYKLGDKHTSFDINQLRSFFSKENNSHLKVGFTYEWPLPQNIKRMLFYMRYRDGIWKGFLKPLPNLLKRLKVLSKGENIQHTLPDLENAKKEADSANEKDSKLELFRLLKAQNLFTAKWQPLPDFLSGKMAAVYGRGCGNYLYRYVPEKRSVLIVRIQNGPVKDNSPHFGGEIYLGDPSRKNYGLWQSYNMENTVKMLNHYLIKPEIQKHIAERGRGSQNARG